MKVWCGGCDGQYAVVDLLGSVGGGEEKRGKREREGGSLLSNSTNVCPFILPVISLIRGHVCSLSLACSRKHPNTASKSSLFTLWWRFFKYSTYSIHILIRVHELYPHIRIKFDGLLFASPFWKINQIFLHVHLYTYHIQRYHTFYPIKFFVCGDIQHFKNNTQWQLLYRVDQPC